MTQESRPLSPHIQIYRWQITMVLSILHRGSGIVLSAGALVLAWWLIALGTGPEAFEQVQTLLTSLPGKLALVVFSAAFYFHLCNGIRHLFWDAGQGFEMPTVRRSGWSVVIATVVLTVATWLLAGGVGLA